MKKQFENFLLSPIYPLLLSVYPILTLFTTNIYEISFSVLLRPLFFSFLVGVLIFGGMQVFFHDWHKSAFFATVVIFFLGFYGHVKSFLDAKEVSGAFIYILIGGLFIFSLLLFFEKKNKGKIVYASLAPSINLIAIILLLFPLAKISQHYIAKKIAFSSVGEITNSFHPLDVSNLETLPDIYYIIPDAHGRSDILKEIYDYDNSEFIAELEELDFYVAKCSQSNYPITLLSLTSSLNGNYIPELNEHFTPEEDDILYLFAVLRNSSVHHILSKAGYETVAFSTGFPWAEMSNADIFLSPSSGAINEFEIMFLQTTFAQFLDDIAIVDFKNIRAERYRERTRLVFDSIPDIVEMPGPKFVFIHLILPHHPYGFDAMGNAINPAQVSVEEGYSNQATYFEHEIVKNIKIIIEQSESSPIIIIQGDHGPSSDRSDQHFPILNAYYFPEHTDSLYATISPVNTFRLVFNKYFEEDYPLLDDGSYSWGPLHGYDFIQVENNCEE